MGAGGAILSFALGAIKYSDGPVYFKIDKFWYNVNDFSPIQPTVKPPKDLLFSIELCKRKWIRLTICQQRIEWGY